MIKSLKKQQNTIHDTPALEYLPEKKAPGNRLSRNLAITGLLLLTITSVRNAKLPDGNTVMTAVEHLVDADWDDDLGKISFVSNLFPETLSVFLNTPYEERLTAPCFGDIVHPWKKDEPYLGYQTADLSVYSAASGQVMNLAHGLNEEKILRIRHDNGLETIYYNLDKVFVEEGDVVTVHTCIGEIIKNEKMLMETRKDGLSIDPTAYIDARSEAAL